MFMTWCVCVSAQRRCQLPEKAGMQCWLQLQPGAVVGCMHHTLVDDTDDSRQRGSGRNADKGALAGMQTKGLWQECRLIHSYTHHSSLRCAERG